MLNDGRKIKLLFVGVVSAALAVLAFGGWRLIANQAVPLPAANGPGDVIDLPTVEEFDKKQYSLSDPQSLWVIINRERGLPDGWRPDDLVTPNVGLLDKPAAELQLRAPAAVALEELVAAAAAEELTLRLGSGFRSQESQAFYYDNYVRTYGQQAADRFSARPGHSEHQTGLAADLAGPSDECYLEACFADLPEGRWVADNAHRFGFIVRYPQNKEAITGYMYEPWHLRYVGVELASELYKRTQTMEEFFGLEAH